MSRKILTAVFLLFAAALVAAPQTVNTFCASNLSCTVTGAYSFSQQITSSISTGTAPFSIASTTVVPNLNAQLLNGLMAPASAILGLTDTQAPTNKTIDISLNNLKNSTNTAGHVPRNNGTQYVDAQPGFADLSGTASTSQIGTGTPAAGKYVDGGTGAWTSIPTAPTVTSINLEAATGNCGTQTFLTPGANALYRVGATVTITTNAGTSSTTPTIAVSYTDADSNTTVSTNAGTIVNSSGSNTVGPIPTLGPIYINAKAGTAITFSCSGYASNPVLTMAYTVHARLEGTF